MENLFSIMQQTLTQPDKNKLLENQQINQETINNLIENASEMMIRSTLFVSFTANSINSESE